MLPLLVALLAFVPGLLAGPGADSEHDRRWPTIKTSNRTQTNFSNSSQTNSTHGTYLLGVGKADITGPVASIKLSGYANDKQKGGGIRQRIYSRAFIIGDVKKPDDRIIYVVLDNLVGDTAIRYGVLEALEDLGPEYAMYGQNNVALASTHSHSGPGGWNNYLLPQIPGRGFHKKSYKAIVDGAVLSIKRAHESLAEARSLLFFFLYADLFL